MELHRLSPSTVIGANTYFSCFQRQASRKATARAVLQAYALPQRSFKRNIEEAQKQFESKLPVPSFFFFFFFFYCFVHFFTLPLLWQVFKLGTLWL